MGLYERLLQEVVQELEENPEREKQRRRLAHKRQKMQAYIKRWRTSIADDGGYATSEEIREEQERHLADLQALRSFMINGVRGPNGGYRLANLRCKYPMDYAYLRDIVVSSK